jgi:putative transposase
VNELVDAHDADSTFGYRFLADEVAMGGWHVSERRVWRLCSDMKLWASYLKKAGSGKTPGPAVHDDLVERRFGTDEPNALWFTDVTEHWTSEGKLYLCSLEDAFSSRIVGYSIGSRMTRHLACGALRNAIALRAPVGTIVHSDCGQYLSIRHTERLGEAEIVASVGSKGDSYFLGAYTLDVDQQLHRDHTSLPKFN